MASCRLSVSMYKREQALKGLPGPKHPLLLGMMVDLVCRRDPHRYATELAEQYGPIFKFRLLIFHVIVPFLYSQSHQMLTFCRKTLFLPRFNEMAPVNPGYISLVLADALALDVW